MEDEERENREDRRIHLEFIQNNIARMHKASFQLKNMTITIVTALIAAFVTLEKNIFLLWIAIGSSIVFWFLDTSYLICEKKFKKIYEDVINNQVSNFEIPITDCKYNVCAIDIFFSKTEILFYAPIVICMIIVLIKASLNNYCSSFFCVHRFF